MTDLAEIKSLVVAQGAAWDGFARKTDERFRDLESEVRAVYARANREATFGSGASSKGASFDPEYKTAFVSFLRSGRESQALQRKGMATDSGPDGGYLVPAELDSMITRALRELSPMRQIARVLPVSSGDFSMLHSTGGAGFGWVGEREERPETDAPSFLKITPPIGEIYAEPRATQKMLDDSAFDLEALLLEEITEAFAAGEGAAFISGNGVERPRGLLTYDMASTVDGSRAETAFQYLATGASGAFPASNPADKLIALVHALKPRYRKNARWLLNTNSLEQVRAFKDSTGNYLWRAGLEGGQPDTLLGYPIAEDENMPDIAAGSLSIAFGDFERGYTVLDRNSAMLRDPYTAKPWVKFYTTRRVGGGARDCRAIKFLKFSAS